MEVEIEDLHVQMDDISKSKQAVSLSVFGKRITLDFISFFYFFYVRVREMHRHRHHLSSSSIGGSQDVVSIIYQGEMISAHNGTFPIPALIRTGCIAVKYITL